jgi:hypothetical protein
MKGSVRVCRVIVSARWFGVVADETCVARMRRGSTWKVVVQSMNNAYGRSRWTWWGTDAEGAVREGTELMGRS